MADDRDLILGQLQEGFKGVKELIATHAQVTEQRFNRVEGRLDEQNRTTEVNKNEAIKKRDEKETRDEQRFQVLDQKATITGGRVSVLEKFNDEEVKPVVAWHREEASKFGGRISILEQERLAAAAEKARLDTLRASEDGEKRGKAWMVAKVVSVIVLIGTFLGWLGADKISALLFQLAVRLGHG